MKKLLFLLSGLALCLTLATCTKDNQPVYKMTLDGSYEDNETGKTTDINLCFKHVILYDSDEISGHYVFRNGDKDFHASVAGCTWLWNEDLWIGILDEDKIKGSMLLPRFDDQFDENDTEMVRLDGEATPDGTALSFSGTFHFGWKKVDDYPLGAPGPYYKYGVSGTFTLVPAR